MNESLHAAIHLPQFALQTVLRHEPALNDLPVALIDGKEPKASVIQLTAQARAAGVTLGLTSTQAMARCSKVVIRSRSQAQEEAAIQALFECAYSFSPYLEISERGWATLDLRGLKLRLRSGDEANLPLVQFGHAILQRLKLFHLRGRIGIARHPVLARHAAREAKTVQVIHDPESFIQTLPIEALAPSPKTAAILASWGIQRVGALLQLGKESLFERLGEETAALFERARPSQCRPLKLAEPPVSFQESFEFESPVESLEPLLFILRRFLEQLTLRLEQAGRVVEELHLTLHLTDGPAFHHAYAIPAPTNNIDTLFRMLHTHLENVRADHPIASLRLRAVPGKNSQQQLDLFENSLRDPNRFHETLARLNALLGAGQAGTPRRKDSHRPDHFDLSSLQLNAPAASGKPIKIKRRLPFWRFRPPSPAKVELRNGSPSAFHSQRGSGRIIKARGPWKLSGEWWDRSSWAHEEWDVETSSGTLYRLRHEKETWFVEGLYD